MRRRKVLVDVVRDGSYRARRDEDLLGARSELPWPKLEEFREAYRARRGDPEQQRQIALELERQLRGVDGPISILGDLQSELRRLGRPGSYVQLERFASKYFRHFAGSMAGQPFVFESFQRSFLREFWRRDKHGHRIYNKGLLGIPKGNGKTPLAAVLGTHALVAAKDETPEVYVISGAKDQAGICHTFARNNIDAGALAAWLNVGASISYPANLGEFEILSSDGDLAHGTNPSGAIVDEWWQFLHRKQREGYIALAEALHKRGGESWLLAITTAGWTKDSQLGETFDAAIAHPKLQVLNGGFLLVLADRESGFLMHWYGIPEGDEHAIDDPKVVGAANPAGWIRPSHLVRDLHQPGADEYAFRRLHGNQWTNVKGVWLPTGSWAKLLAPELEIPVGAEIYVGVDAAHSHDTTAVAWAWQTPSGRIVVRVEIWAIRPEAPAHHHVDDFYDENDIHVAEKFIRELGKRFKIREVVGDPNYFGPELRRLGRRFTTAPLFPWSKEMTEYVQEFYRHVDSGHAIAHNGDRILGIHLANIEGKKDSRTGYWKLDKLHDANPMDGGVASIIAVGRASSAKPRAKPWAATR